MNDVNECASRFCDALQTLAENLQPLVDKALAAGDQVTAQRVRRAKADLERSVADMDAAALSALFAGNPAFAQLEGLTEQLQRTAREIGSQEQGAARAVGIAASVVSLAGAVGSGNVAGAAASVGEIARVLALER